MSNEQYNNSKKLLTDGIYTLCKDENVNSLISGRKDEVISLLERYIKEIETFNDAYGLVKVNNTDELIIRHILDSLAPIGIIMGLLKHHCSSKIADVGSGAGLPGIPLAITLPDCDFTLIERMGKRAKFLFNIQALLGLSNIHIEENDVKQTGKAQFDLVVFRAFSPLEPKMINTVLKTCKETGNIAAYKGQREKIKQEITAIEKICNIKEIVQYNTPFLNEQRHLVVLKPNKSYS